MPACRLRDDHARRKRFRDDPPLVRVTPPVTGDQRHCESRRALEARKRQLYGRPYMRSDAINWFASSELCRSLQDGGKTPLTLRPWSASPHSMPSKPTFAALPPMNAARRSSGAQNLLSTLWLEAQLATVSGQSTTAGAIRYALSRWEGLIDFPDSSHHI